MSERRTRSSGAAQGSGSRASLPTPSLRRSQRKSGSDLPSILPEICPKATPVRKPIVLKKIVAHAVQIPSVDSPRRRSPRIVFSLEKENHPPAKEPAKEELFRKYSVPATPAQSPDVSESASSEGDLDTRDLDMSKKVRRSYSRLAPLHCASASASTSTPTPTPGRPSCFGFERLLGTEDLAGVSPLVCSTLTEVPRVPEHPLVPDTTLPGISPAVKEKKKKKKKVPEILSPQSSLEDHSEPIEEPVVQPVEQESLEDPQPPSSESKQDLQPEPTVKFLFTLLSSVEPSEPKEQQEDFEVLESRFLDEEDWGSQQASKEINHLYNACLRLQESMSTIQADNAALKEKLQNLPDLVYNTVMEELKAVPEDGPAAQEEDEDVLEEELAAWEAGLFQVDRQSHGEW